MEIFDAEKSIYEDAHVEGIDLSGQVVPAVEAIGTLFERMVLAGATLQGWTLEKCHLRNCDFSNAMLDESIIDDVHFEGCKLVGVNFSGASAMTFNARFTDCSLRLAVFTGVNLSGVRFERCDLRDVDFTQADCRRARFSECDLAGALFDRSDLREADFSGAKHVLFDPEQNRIRDTKISNEVAVAFAERRGFVVD